MEKIKQNAFVKKVGFNRIILVLVMLVMYLSFGLLTGGKFFGMSRIMDTMNYVYFLGFLSLGVTFVIATGGIDFSIGPVMFCCALVSGTWNTNGCCFDLKRGDRSSVWYF